MTKLLEVCDLGYGYRGRTLGTGLHIGLGSGEVLCLLGPNGSGKTTLFKTLLGLLPVHAGTLRFEGRDMALWSRYEFARALAYVPQSPPGNFTFSAEQAVMMGRAPHIPLFSRPTARDREIVASTLRIMGIEALAGRRFAFLSGGERQLVIIARALAQESRLVIMDEPTANLDFGNRVHVLEQIKRLRSLGVAVIVSTHEPEQAFQIANQVALLHDGRFLGIGPPHEVITEASLHTLYGVDVVIKPISDGESDHWVCLPRRRGSSDPMKNPQYTQQGRRGGNA